MKCTKCGQDFISLFFDICPYCGADNSKSSSSWIISTAPSEKSKSNKDTQYDPYDWENPDNCSDREYEDDDDYDDV